MRSVFRSGREAAISAGTAIVLTAVLAPHAVMEHPSAVVTKGVELVLAAVIALLGFRLYMACVATDADGIEVINPFHRTRIPWRDIKGFSIARHGTGTMVALATLRDGSTVPLVGLRASIIGRGSQRRLRASVAELETERAAFI